eukprot:COSAG02_NODE_64185_length_261_cov_0.641975_1_plen_49_part_10
MTHPGLVALSPKPLRVLAGHVLLNEALPTHALTIRSKNGALPLRTQTED